MAIEMTAEKFWYWVGGRRFLLTVGAGIVHTGLLVLGFIDQSTFKELTIATTAVYIAGSTYQKVKGQASA